MATDHIAAIHTALGYTEADAQALRQVRLVWKRLEGLKAKALKGGTQELRAYSELLEKSLGPARLVQELPDVAQAAEGFWAWYTSEAERLGIAALELARGSDHQAWCEKWQKADYSQFIAGYNRFIEMPSQASVNEAKIAAGKMLLAYVEAFKND